jgi:hypothetical protein
LSEARLVAAREMGCTIATLSARPYNGSARNAERAGFTLAYTKSTFVSNRNAGALQHVSKGAHPHG